MKKTFDCVEMKRKAQARIRRELSGKSIDEQLAYWKAQEKRLWAEPARRKPARRKAS